jgi:hypothetical protein
MRCDETIGRQVFACDPGTSSVGEDLSDRIQTEPPSGTTIQSPNMHVRARSSGRAVPTMPFADQLFHAIVHLRRPSPRSAQSSNAHQSSVPFSTESDLFSVWWIGWVPILFRHGLFLERATEQVEERTAEILFA